jgi:antitoxin YefM
MRVMSYSQVRQELATVMDQVTSSRDAVIVTRQNADSVVMLPLEEYEAMQETMHLLRSPANAEHLHKSIASADAGKAKARTRSPK